MFLEVLDNKIISVNALELQKSSTFYFLPQEEQFAIHQAVNDMTSEWVKEKQEELGEENVTQEMCDEQMKLNFVKKFEEVGITDVDVILINGTVTYLYDNEEDAKQAYEVFRMALMEGQTYMILHSEFLASKIPQKEVA